MANQITGALANVNYQRLVKLSTGRQVFFADTASGVILRYSDDGGLNWQTATSPASGVVSSLTSSVVVARRDEDDRIHALVGSTAVSTRLDLLTVSLSGTSATVTTTAVEPNADSNHNYSTMDLLVSGAAGATKTLYLGYALIDWNPGLTQTLYARTVTVTTGATVTLNTRSTIDSNTESGTRFQAALSQRADGTVKLIWQQFNTPNLKVYSFADSSKYTLYAGYSSSIGFVGVDGLADCWWVGAESGKVTIWKDAGAGGGMTTSDATLSAGGVVPAAVGDTAGNRLLLVAKHKTTGYPRLVSYDVAGNTFTDKGTVSTTATVSAISGPRRYDGTVPYAFHNGTNVYSEAAMASASNSHRGYNAPIIGRGRRGVYTF